MHNTRVWRLGRTDLPQRRTKQRCIYEGCDKWRVAGGYCAMHWRRIQKHGDPSIVKKTGRQRSGRPTVLKNGYLMIHQPEHPLAGKSGQVLLHRKVLYDLIGPGSHPCHECGRTVTWSARQPDRLDVDHLDSNRSNNDPSNLAPSCHRCNDGQALRQRTHCAQGHKYTPENTHIDPRGRRRCRECMREYSRQRTARRLAAGLTAKGTPRRRVRLRP